MGGGVPEGVLALLVVPGEELHGGVLMDRAVEFGHFVVDFGSQDVASQPLGDAFCYVQGGDTSLMLMHGTIW